MNLEQEFERRIAAIHRLDNGGREQRIMDQSGMDIRHEEFQARASVFLGDDFDQGKLWLVETLQTALHDRQADLFRHFEAHELDPEQYVESFNTLLDDTFAACEAILGNENFLKLFGAERSELSGFIDREAFLEANQRHNRDQRPLRIFTVQIPLDKVALLIGRGASVIRELGENTGCSIDIDEQTGNVTIASDSSKKWEACFYALEQMTAEPIAAGPEMNKIYLGTVQRMADFGAFVEIMPGTEGLLHVSDIAEYRVANIRDELQEGQQLLVKVINIGPSGKVRLSAKAVQRERIENVEHRYAFDDSNPDDRGPEEPGQQVDRGPGGRPPRFGHRRPPRR